MKFHIVGIHLHMLSSHVFIFLLNCILCWKFKKIVVSNPLHFSVNDGLIWICIFYASNLNRIIDINLWKESWKLFKRFSKSIKVIQKNSTKKRKFITPCHAHVHIEYSRYFCGTNQINFFRFLEFLLTHIFTMHTQIPNQPTHYLETHPTQNHFFLPSYFYYYFVIYILKFQFCSACKHTKKIFIFF